ncbi:MAG: hypothetical protein ISR65_08275 [Bacteriovoracaceae bacterium]|nr:hypothetical protein [Bacteriovoracaceae bacterium]
MVDKLIVAILLLMMFSNANSGVTSSDIYDLSDLFEVKLTVLKKETGKHRYYATMETPPKIKVSNNARRLYVHLLLTKAKSRMNQINHVGFHVFNTENTENWTKMWQQAIKRLAENNRLIKGHDWIYMQVTTYHTDVQNTEFPPSNLVRFEVKGLSDYSVAHQENNYNNPSFNQNLHLKNQKNKKRGMITKRLKATTSEHPIFLLKNDVTCMKIKISWRAFRRKSRDYSPIELIVEDVSLDWNEQWKKAVVDLVKVYKRPKLPNRLYYSLVTSTSSKGCRIQKTNSAAEYGVIIVDGLTKHSADK